MGLTLDVPDHSPSRIAISAEMACPPATFSLNRFKGTPSSRAKPRPGNPRGDREFLTQHLAGCDRSDALSASAIHRGNILRANVRNYLLQ
jgi:hypothetical protein